MTPDTAFNFVLSIVSFASITVLAFISLFSTYKRSIYKKEVKHQQSLMKAIITTQEKEREEISKNLHDDLGATLSTVNLFLSEMADDVQDISQYERTKAVLDEAKQKVRHISKNLTPRVVKEYGFIKASEGFLKRIESTKLDIYFENSIEKISIEEQDALILYRVVQELVNNTLKHAKASAIHLSIYETDRVYIEYWDNGKGYDPKAFEQDPNKGLGLKNIESRVQSLSCMSKLKYETTDNHKTKVVISLKLK